jgi:hypothetical protein
MIALPQSEHLYCEFVFWQHPDQPFNVYSNLAYLIAALFILARRKDFLALSRRCLPVCSS